MIIRLMLQTVAIALRQIWANKIRAMLTCLGIIIGVAAVVSTVAAVDGLKSYVLNGFESFGAKKIFFNGNVPRKMRGRMPWYSTRLKLNEFEAIRKSCTSIDAITPILSGVYDLQSGDQIVRNVQVTGVWPDWHKIEARHTIVGRDLNEEDNAKRNWVCLLNEKAIEELGLDSDPTNSFLLIGGRRFMIIGVVETKDVTFNFGGGETQSEIYIPLSLAMSMKPERRIDFGQAELISPDKAEDAKEEILGVLRRMRGLKPEEENTFEVRVLQSVIDWFNKTATAIGVGAGGVVAISLLVGGIGIMNIMLVSVSERTREIGLRKALGARPSVILLQFLVEAVTLCLIGGAVGLAAGQLLVWLMHLIPGEYLKSAATPTWAILLAVGFCAFTGIAFGMFPAIKAARLNPIDALRHE